MANPKRMISATWSAAGGGPVTPFLAIAYDGLGRRDHIARGTGATTRSQYDGVSRLIWRKQEYASIEGELYTSLGYNPASQIVTQQRTNHEYVFTGATDVVRGYAVNGLNQYTEVGGVAQAHDANGNSGVGRGDDLRIRRREPADLGHGRQDGDAGLRPAGAAVAGAGASTETRFLGACPGRRPGDGDQLAAEYDAAGNLLRRYAWGPDVDEPVLWDEGGALNCSAARLLMGDHQGSVIGLATCAGRRLSVNR